jgi:hypothetical protein
MGFTSLCKHTICLTSLCQKHIRICCNNKLQSNFNRSYWSLLKFSIADKFHCSTCNFSNSRYTDWQAYNNITITLTRHIVLVNLRIVQKLNALSATLSIKCVNHCQIKANTMSSRYKMELDSRWPYCSQNEPKAQHCRPASWLISLICTATSRTSLILCLISSTLDQHCSDGRGDSALELAARPCFRISLATPSSAPAQCL